MILELNIFGNPEIYVECGCNVLNNCQIKIHMVLTSIRDHSQVFISFCLQMASILEKVDLHKYKLLIYHEFDPKCLVHLKY